jgi:hypothetical protein
MVIAERTTSYGFLATLSCKTNSNSTTGANRFMSESSVLLPIKKNNPKLCIQKCNTDPTWGPVMTISMGKANMEVLSAAERD